MNTSRKISKMLDIIALSIIAVVTLAVVILIGTLIVMAILHIPSPERWGVIAMLTGFVSFFWAVHRLIE